MRTSWLKRNARKFGIGLYRIGEEWRLVEPAQLEKFLSHFAIDCVFDVGANTGQYASTLRALGYQGRILSFEPHPTVFDTLQQAATGDDRWSVYEAALDSEPRMMEFNLMAASQFSSLREPTHANTEKFVEMNKVVQKVRLQTTTLAKLYPTLKAEFGFSRPFLKLDTQGHDVAVVEGAREVIKEFVGLQSELSLTGLYRDAPDLTESLTFYRSLGYRLSSLVPNNGGHFPDLVEVDCIMYRDDEAPASNAASDHRDRVLK